MLQSSVVVRLPLSPTSCPEICVRPPHEYVMNIEEKQGRCQYSKVSKVVHMKVICGDIMSKIPRH